MTLGDTATREEALKRVRQAWNAAAASRYLDLDAGNRHRPDDMRYRSQAAMVREAVVNAIGVTDFAVGLGLLSPEERSAFRDEARRLNPEIDSWGVWEVCPNCGGILEGMGMFSGRRPDNHARGGGWHSKCDRCGREYHVWLSGGPRLLVPG